MRAEERLSPIIDSLPKPDEMIVREWPDDYQGTYASWADAVGHPQGKRGCKTCGLGGTCPFRAFWDALVSSVVREVDKRYTIHQRPPAAHLCVCSDSVYNGRTCPRPSKRSGCPREGESGKTFRERCLEKWGAKGIDLADLPDEEPDLNHEDVLFVFGRSPSYRCYISRHEDCEEGPGQPEDGCTCACHGGPREVNCGAFADHDPHGECWGNGPFRKDLRHEWLTQKREEAGLCTCNSREIDEDGKRLHYVECPQYVDTPCGWFTDYNGLRRHGIEQGKKGSTDFVPCERPSAFQQDHERDMQDPEYAETYERVAQELTFHQPIAPELLQKIAEKYGKKDDE